MKTQQKWGICLAITGPILLAILVGVGVFMKNTVNSAPASLLVFTLDNNAADPNYEDCTTSSTNYYFWNLTNLAAVLSGDKSEYSLTGPYVVDSIKCDFDQTIVSSTSMTKRTYEKGQYFRAEASKGSLDDVIINANIAYTAMMAATGGESGLMVAITGPGLTKVIETMQNDTFTTQVLVGAIPTVLNGIIAQAKPQVAPAVAAGIGFGALYATIEAIASQTGSLGTAINVAFNDPSVAGQGFTGFANWTKEVTNQTAENIPAATAGAIFNDWAASKGQDILTFALNVTGAAADYNISINSAAQLARWIGGYLIKNDSFVSQAVFAAYVEGTLYEQWANGTLLPTGFPLGGGLTGFEAGIPQPTNITASVVAQLFDTHSNYSLATTNGITLWFGALQDSTLVPKIKGAFPGLEIEQITMLLKWLYNFYTKVAPVLVKGQFGISDWKDLAYAQWGGLVLGQSLKDLGGLDFYPEVAAFDPSSMGVPASSSKFTAAQAKALLTGSHSLLEAENIGALLVLTKAQDFTTIKALFNISSPQAVALAGYFQYMMQHLAAPVIKEQIDKGSGMYIKRTVEEWLFTATDPLLAFLGQPSVIALSPNSTDDKAAIRAEAPITKRIYSAGGTDDELHASLMPVNDGETIPYYAENTTVSGYGGAQFMPYDDVKDSKYPFVMWFGQTKRQLKLKNQGSVDFGGVSVEHITFDSTVYDSATDNPANAKYYQTHAGMFNTTALPPGAPLFMSRVDLAGTEDWVRENLTLTDDITGAVNDYNNGQSRSIKGQWLEVMPILGAAIHANIAVQINLRIGPTDAFFTAVRPNFAPIMWASQTGAADESQLSQLKMLQMANTMWKALVGVGVGIGVALLATGLILYIRGNKKTKVIRIT